MNEKEKEKIRRFIKIYYGIHQRRDKWKIKQLIMLELKL